MQTIVKVRKSRNSGSRLLPCFLDSEEQATSYETQIEHYTSYIKNHPDWVLAGIYADDGITALIQRSAKSSTNDRRLHGRQNRYDNH